VAGSGEEGLVAADSAVDSVASLDRDKCVNQVVAVGGMGVCCRFSFSRTQPVDYLWSSP